jgi:hypothetical protein
MALPALAWMALVAGANGVAAQSPALLQSQDLRPSTSVAIQAAGIAITEAVIRNGRLAVRGTTAAAATAVTLDDKFTATSAADKTFAFLLVYLPIDCIIELKTSLGVDRFVVASCGPKGVNFIGPWSAPTAYVTDDLVTHSGATWRVRRASTNRPPVAGGDWQLFAARGATGAIGPPGPTGATGATGSQGLRGLVGATGPQGVEGAQGPQGSQGAQGLPGSANVIVRTIDCTSGAANGTCAASCSSGETVLSAQAAFSRGGATVHAEGAPNRTNGWDVGIPGIGYSQISVRLVCLQP